MAVFEDRAVAIDFIRLFINDRYLKFIDKHPHLCPHLPARWNAVWWGQLRANSSGLEGRQVPIRCFLAADKRRFRQEADWGQRASFRPLRWARSLLQSQCLSLSSASLRLSRRRYSWSSGGLRFGFPPGFPRLGFHSQCQHG